MYLTYFYSQRYYPVKEFRQTALQLFNLEPISVEGHHIRRSVLFVISVKVLLQPLEHLFGIVVVKNALIQVRAVSTFVTLHIMRIQG